MIPDADIFIESDRTRIVQALDIAPTRPGETTVALDPEQPSLTVGGSDDSTGGTIRVLDKDGTEPLGQLSGDDGAGTVELTHEAGASTVALDPDIFAERAALEVNREGSATGRVELHREPESERHRLAVFYGGAIAPSAAQPPAALEANSDGEVRVNHEDGTSTATLYGRESALVLTAAPDLGPNQDVVDEQYGGGELVVRASGSPADIHLHAQAEQGSEYGVDDDNRPRIYLDGTEAALELGREATVSGHPPENGRLDIRTDTGESVLTVRVTEAFESEMVFRWLDGSRLKPRGTIRSHPDGIAIYDAGGNEALRIMRNGEIKTRKQVTTNATF